ncbi:hypothetical protein SEA_HIRKO_57 [Arthrobacter phage Hirko]|nr:hypothetical protein SEA_HIRKO_57 [Arthrobacter phage Hirko]
MRIALKLTLNITRGKPAPEPEPEQREIALDALVIPADDRGPRELDANHRPDSYGFMDRGQAIGFSRATRR